MVVTSAAYFAGVMTMVGSTVLVTNSLALASSGMLPAVLPGPGLHLAPAALPGMSPHPALDLPSHLSLPCRTGFRCNETRDAVEGGEEEKEPKPMSASLEPSWMPGKSVVDTILSQLISVLTLKSHLVQFVSAVTDSGISQQSRKKAPGFMASSCVKYAEESQVEEEEERPPADAVISRWFELEESTSREVDGVIVPCVHCRKRKVPSDNGGEVDSGFMLSGSGFQQQCLGNLCWEETVAHHELGCGGRWWWKGQSVCQCQGYCQGYSCGPESYPGGCCSREAMVSMQNLFPDITIGFSTSVPPAVYAT